MKLKITIEGPQGAGKTSMANAIAYLLNGLAFDVTVMTDDRFDRKGSNSARPLRTLARIGEQVSVTIVEKQS